MPNGPMPPSSWIHTEAPALAAVNAGPRSSQMPEGLFLLLSIPQNNKQHEHSNTSIFIYKMGKHQLIPYMCLTTTGN